MIFVLMFIFFLLPIGFVMWKRSQRSRRLSEQLPDALDMMARSLRAGHALSSSFKMVASEMPRPSASSSGAPSRRRTWACRSSGRSRR